jgi:hypothetical protein
MTNFKRLGTRAEKTVAFRSAKVAGPLECCMVNDPV